MSKQHSYEQIAIDYELWCEYVDTNATMTKTEFDKLSVAEKVAIQVDTFGPEEEQKDN